MIAVMQRVSQAAVHVEGRRVGHIGGGALVLLAVERGDGEQEARRLLARMLNYRMFADANGRMNLSVRDVDGGVLLVPQFTLAADTAKGNRPSFTPAAEPAQGLALFEYLQQLALAAHGNVQFGRFGADMKVSLVNDGPVTFILRG